EERGYQFCLIDPEGDFEGLAGALVVGSPTEQPDAKSVGQALTSTQSLLVNLMGVPLPERPGAFQALLPRIPETRATTGRPHWLAVEEAHHLLPTPWSPPSSAIPQGLGGTILVTVHPEHVSPAALTFVDMVIATGKAAAAPLAEFPRAAQITPPRSPLAEPQP